MSNSENGTQHDGEPAMSPTSQQSSPCRAISPTANSSTPSKKRPNEDSDSDGEQMHHTSASSKKGNKFFKSRDQDDMHQAPPSGFDKVFQYMKKVDSAETENLSTPLSGSRYRLGTTGGKSSSTKGMSPNINGLGNTPIPEKNKLKYLTPQHKFTTNADSFYGSSARQSFTSITPKTNPSYKYTVSRSAKLIESLGTPKSSQNGGDNTFRIQSRTPLSPRSSSVASLNRSAAMPGKIWHRNVASRNINFDKENSMERTPEKKHDVFEFTEPIDLTKFDGPFDVGFANFGNTCYMNATLQSLLSLPPFYRDVLFEFSIMSALLPPLQTLIQARQDCNVNVTNASLKSLRQVFSKHVDTSFRGDKQHDASEFLNKLIGSLSDDISLARRQYFTSSQNDINSTFIEDNFQTIVAEESECNGCGDVSFRRDRSLLVFLPVPTEQGVVTKTETEDDSADGKTEECPVVATPTLQECPAVIMPSIQSLIIEYFSGFSGSCGKCEDGTIYTSTKIESMPRMIMIQLKRYNNSGDKIATPIKISPFLDLDEYLMENCAGPKPARSGAGCSEIAPTPHVNGDLDQGEEEEEEMKQATRMSFQEQQQQEEEEEEQLKQAMRDSLQDLDSDSWTPSQMETYLSVPKQLKNCYRLMSMVCHRGYSSDSGHYISHVYRCDADAWYTYNDTVVTKAGPEIFNIKNQQSCYMLVYMHRDIFESVVKECCVLKK